MKNLLVMVVLQCISFRLIAQKNTNDSVGCDFINNIKFKDGIDTIEFTVRYNSFISANQDPILPVLSERKQILADEYQDKNYHSTYVEFMLPNCDRRFMGILNRKIYDRTFIRRNVGDYQIEIVDLNSIDTYQKIFLKCVVFKDESLKDRRGGYFFEILELKPL